jgi:23S rRNA (adenine2030-N6)-methyltransferase
MNYRHAFHAGNFADVLKHAVLALCLTHLTRKDKPLRYIDTHAGIGRYDLTSDEARRSPEWQGGVARVMDAARPAAVEAALAPWLAAVRAANPDSTLTAYPGSPDVAAHILRPQDRMHLCELHEADCRTLDQRYIRDARVKAECRDGYKALSALLPPRERRGLVMIDPPFEQRDEMVAMARAARAALERWPTGTYIFWRPLKDLWSVERFDSGLAQWLLFEQDFEPEKVLRADLWVRDLTAEGKLAGAGIVVVNPPHTLEGDLLALLPWLSETLAQCEGAGWRLDGAVTDETLELDEDAG